LSQHLNRANRFCHWLGTTLSMFLLIGGLVSSPWFFTAILPVGYGLAWIGHIAFEKNRPATFVSWWFAVWSFACDLRMWAIITLRTDSSIRGEIILFGIKYPGWFKKPPE
jgi:hypothetical protein